MANVGLDFFINLRKDGLSEGLKGGISMLDLAVSKIEKIGQKAFALNQIGQVFGQATQAARGMGEPFLQFESQLKSIGAIADMSKSDLSLLEIGVKKMGEQFGVSTTSVLDATREIASSIDAARVGGTKGLLGLTESAVMLSKASEAGLGESARALTATIEQYSLASSNAGETTLSSNRIMNVLAASTKIGRANVAQLVESLKEVGPVAGGAGLSIEQTNGALVALGNKSILGSQAGNQLKGVLLSLQTKRGIDFNTTSLSTALKDLQPVMSNAIVMEELFGRENIAAAQALIASSDSLDDHTRKLTGSTAAQQLYNDATDTSLQRVKMTQAWLENLKLSLGGLAGGWVAAGSTIAAEVSDFMAGFGQIGGAIFSLMEIRKANTMISKLDTIASGHNTAANAANAGSKNLLSLATIRQTFVTNLATGATTLLNGVLMAMPWVAAIAGAAAFVAGIVWVYNHIEETVAFLRSLWEGIVGFFKSIGDSIINVVKGPFHVIRGLITGDMALVKQGLLDFATSAANPVGMFAKAGQSGFKAGMSQWYKEQPALVKVAQERKAREAAGQQKEVAGLPGQAIGPLLSAEDGTGLNAVNRAKASTQIHITIGDVIVSAAKNVDEIVDLVQSRITQKLAEQLSESRFIPVK